MGADLTGAKLCGTDLTRANLCGASLIGTQALNANFEHTILTGVALEDWSIHSDINLNNVICDYVYLKAHHQERRPSHGEFAPGEFIELFQKGLVYR